MPKSFSSFGPDLTRRVTAIAEAVDRSKRDVVKAAAFAAKTEHNKVIRRDSGGDMRLSGVGRRKGKTPNPRIGATYRIQTHQGGLVSAWIRPYGPVHLINADTGGRVIRSAWLKGSGRRSGKIKGQFVGQFVGPDLGHFKGDRRAVINIPGVGFRRSARHPGTKGKDTWKRGRRKAQPAIARELGSRTDRVIATAFRTGVR